ncbi:hypothetical protein MBLNU459_g2951t1 [Dothideomycetes sp. NU459]
MEPPKPGQKSTAQTYEQDPRWTAVDRYALSHLHTPSAPYYAALEFAAHNAQQNGLPDIAVSPLQGQFLALQVRLLRAKHILEVGTLGGYSTIWLAGATGPDTRVTTVEVDERHARVARESIARAGLGDRVEVVVGAGADVLPRLRGEVAAGARPRFDFAFVDADKENNLLYVDEIVEMARVGACVIVDNVVRKGTVVDAELAETDPRVKGSRAVIEGAGKHPRLDATLMQIVGEKNYDGFLVCLVK